ncbi:tripartite tricarboxylate transporter TctB family protein [Aurantimonas sp. A2-1-M11]|uniref:tripartite tricarboxylate transporter TctB family protein n=1 Tax=Aurantimonas sp. A2-1-M11 TaxID=3113712 RepID=UPI002F9467EA
MSEGGHVGPAADSRSTAWKDVGFAGVFLALGLYSAYHINYVDTPGFIMSTGRLDYAAVPTIASLGIVILSLIYLAGSLRRAFSAPLVLENRTPIAWSVVVRRIGTLLLLIGFILMLKQIPFFIASAIFLSAMFVLLGQTSLWRIGLVALVGAGALHLLFVVALSLPL